jgi:hypothetical protein
MMKIRVGNYDGRSSEKTIAELTPALEGAVDFKEDTNCRRFL